MRDQARFLKRQLSLPVSTMSQWWVRRSRSAVVIFGSPNTLGHSPKARLVVGEREIAEFVEDDDVEASEIVGDASLASGSTFGLELINEIDGGEEAPARSSADATPRDGDGQMRLACAGPADE